MKDQRTLDLDLINSINVDSGLTDWEAEFVDSVLRQLKSDHPGNFLSERQRAVAERIQRKLDSNERR